MHFHHVSSWSRPIRSPPAPCLHSTDTFITLCRSKKLSRGGVALKTKTHRERRCFRGADVCSGHFICLLSSRATQLMTNVTVIQIQRLKTLNTENSMSVSSHACELSPVIRRTHIFWATLKCNLETAYYDSLINPPFMTSLTLVYVPRANFTEWQSSSHFLFPARFLVRFPLGSYLIGSH